MKDKIFKGTVVDWFETKGYGWIRSEGHDYFLHISDVLDSNIEEGSEILFIITRFRGRIKAVQVH